MSKESKRFLKKMLCFFPSAKDEFDESIEKFDEPMETVIVEDIFMPKVIKLLKEDRDTEFLDKLFEYFEEVANCDDVNLENLFSVTVLEILGNDKKILETAKKYMRSETMRLQREADRDLGRVRL